MANEMTVREIAIYFGVSEREIQEVIRLAKLKVKNRLEKHGIYKYSDVSVDDFINGIFGRDEKGGLDE